MSRTGRAMTAVTRLPARSWNGRPDGRLQVPFEDGLPSTIDWYRRNRDWVARVKSGEYQDFYKLNYTR